MKRIVWDVDEDIHALIKVKAAQEKRSIKEILEELVSKWLKKK